jgi:hypothetical protein
MDWATEGPSGTILRDIASVLICWDIISDSHDSSKIKQEK